MEETEDQETGIEVPEDTWGNDGSADGELPSTDYCRRNKEAKACNI